MPLEKRVEVIPVGHGIDRLILTYGFDEAPSVPAGVAAALDQFSTPIHNPDSANPTARSGLSCATPDGRAGHHVEALVAHAR